ncbi:hypothetical protein E0E50_19475 [Azotobacter chroococcum subsp. isscasi]|uniref:hypothetical protein n=1 Tax=Azotobacter chroococcum TaxID=353 RepID=UPI001039D2D7|nr:hypothetical protein [Azotobacter chroococcum]TBW06628.1 hypothetical protein E0E50_19475 [Azotobacter chroococcum subsp. isscasi]
MYSRRNFLKTSALPTAGLFWLSLQGGIYATSAQTGQDGWCNALIHQLYPCSFADAHGDAIGDLAGINNFSGQPVELEPPVGLRNIAGEAVVSNYAPRNVLGRHLALQPSLGTSTA